MPIRQEYEEKPRYYTRLSTEYTVVDDVSSLYVEREKGGFLFKAMCRDSIRWAVVVSSVTFGLGHILNLVNGSGMSLVENLVQIICAVLIGFLYVIIFHRGGSLWPCIISHGVFNSLSAFSSGNESMYHIAILCVLVVSYALMLLKTLPKEYERSN